MLAPQCVHVVDDEPGIRHYVTTILAEAGFAAIAYPSAHAFLEERVPETRGCLVLDLCMQGMNGRELQRWLLDHDVRLPIIFITGNGDVRTAVDAIKDGAVDFIEKPLNSHRFIDVVRTALQTEQRDFERRTQVANFDERLTQLSSGEREVLEGLVNGRNYKDLAQDLNVSYKTIEARRSRVLRKLEAKSTSDLIRMMFVHRSSSAAGAFPASSGVCAIASGATA